MLRKNIFFTLLLFITKGSFAQLDSIEVSGILKDKSTREPIEFATVAFTKTADSMLVFYTITDTEGRFLIDHLTPGPYRLNCFLIGYEKIDTVIIIPGDKEKYAFQKLAMQPSAFNLKEVEVIGDGDKLLKVAIDRKIYNVGKDIQGASGSASDILRNIPSVQVDMEGELTLRGSSGVLILINGRVSPIMKGKTRAEALQQLPAGSIERIEVISNPSAKYRPDGNVGIINIVLKKNTKLGVNGSLTINTGNNDNFSNDRHNGNALISYKPGKLNLYGGFGLRQNRYFRYRTMDRTNFDSNGQVSALYNEYNHMVGSSLSNNVNFGIDYEMDTLNTIGASVNYFHFKVNRENRSDRNWFDKDRIIESQYDFITNILQDETEVETGLTYEHKFKKPEHTLEMEVSSTFQIEKENNYYTNTYEFPFSSQSKNNILVNKNDNPVEASIDYSNPISEDAVLEMGYSGLFNNIKMNYRGETFDAAKNNFLSDTSTSYYFVYNDMINAVYATYEFAIEDLGIQPGLRLEQVNLKGNVTDRNIAFTNSYFNFYPSLHLSYDLDPGEIQLSYSRRVNRPDGDELNPLPEYDDPRDLYAGNPKLLPEFIHSVQLGLNLEKKKFSFVPTLYYSQTKNGFYNVTDRINDSTLLTTMQNISTNQETGLEFIFTGKPLKWLSGTLSSNVFYDQIDASNIGYSGNRSLITYNTNLNANISIANSSILQLNCSYNSPRITPQGTYSSYFLFNFGMKQNLYKNKLAITLTINDVFKTLRQEMKLTSPEISQISKTTRDSRFFYIGLSYKFGGTTKKQKEEALQFDNAL